VKTGIPVVEEPGSRTDRALKSQVRVTMNGNGGALAPPFLYVPLCRWAVTRIVT
jgi:hypothetical protein